MSVTAVLIFGEIVPSALFTGPAQLAMAAACIPLVRLLMFLFWPVAWPLSRVLDLIFGEDSDDEEFTRYDYLKRSKSYYLFMFLYLFKRSA